MPAMQTAAVSTIPSSIAQTSFCYQAESMWVPVPPWVQYFLDLGSALGSISRDQCLVVGLTLPLRAFAAPLIGVGIVRARSLSAPLAASDPEHIFRRLQLLAPGASVIYKRTRKAYRGIFEGITESGGKQYACVRISTDTVYLVPRERACQIEMAADNIIALPSVAHGQPVHGLSAFAQDLMGLDGEDNHAGGSRLDCTIVGQVSRLKAEIDQAPFACQHPALATQSMGMRQAALLHTGTLQQVLRVRRLSSPSELYRSNIYSARRTTEVKSSEIPFAAILDGADSFLRWRDTWPESHWIVVLDRTERAFDDAVQAFNEGYQRGIAAGTGPLNIPSPPVGVELSIYRRTST
jgi:hypothetical protein